MSENPIKQKKLKSSRFMRLLTDNKFVFFAGLFAALIMIFVYAVYKFFPFGTMTILRMDLYHQYGPLFAEFYERVFRADGFLYSWCSGLGSCFLGNYYNYLSSPANIVMLIAGHENMPEAIAVMILIKNAFAAGTFAYFLKKAFNRNDLSIAGFGVLYAFCGHYMAYYWNIMWLDGMIAFPLVILGIMQIIDSERKPYLYCLALAYAMITSYYMAYMICLLSVIFFLVYYFSHYDLGSTVRENGFVLKKKQYERLPLSEKLKLFYLNVVNSRFMSKGVSFAFFSIFAFLISAFALIPVYFILKNSSATSGSFPSDYSTYFNFFDFIANHLAGAEPTIRSSGEDVLPNIYSGILPLILAPLYLFSKKYNFKEKFTTVLLYAVFYFSFNINYLNYIWHGFHFPNDLPYRFSFAYTFFLLYFAYKAFDCLEEFSSRAITGVGLGVIGFAVLAQKIGSKNVDDTVVLETIIFAVMYCAVLIMLKNTKYVKSAIIGLLVCSICTEIIVVDTANFQMTQKKEYFTGKYEDFVDLKEKVDEMEEDNAFWRMELSDLLARMDSCWYYYNGVSVFSSMAYESVSKLQKKLGMYGNDVNSHTYFPQTAVYNSMFALKYIFDNNALVSNEHLYDRIESNDSFTAYRFKYFLPVAYCVDESLANYWSTSDDNPFKVQSAFFKAASGIDEIFKPLTLAQGDLTNVNELSQYDLENGSISFNKTSYNNFGVINLTITPETDGNVYLYIKSSAVKNLCIITENKTFDYEISTPYVLDVGHCKAGETITLQVNLPDDDAGNSGTFNVYAVGMDENEFKKGYENILKAGTLNVTEFNNENYIKGEINAAKDKILYTSIPYDIGWNVYIDGEQLDKEAYILLGKSMLAVPISEGEHTIEFKYIPSGLYLGMSISAIALVLLIVLIILNKKKAFIFSQKFTSKLTCEGYIPSTLLADMALEEEARAAEAGFEEMASDSADESEAQMPEAALTAEAQPSAEAEFETDLQEEDINSPEQ